MIFGEDMDKSMVACFFWLTVYKKAVLSQGNPAMQL